MTYHILVVEDDPDIRELINLYLMNHGYKVIQAADGDEAIRQLDEQDIHLAILDIVLPDTDGWHICQHILKKKPNLPVIFLSCKDEADDIIHGLNIGADDYVTKPFDPLVLVARVNARLRRRNLPGIALASQEEDQADKETLEELTPHEKEILHLIARGLSNKQIADRLNYTLGTVKVYNHRIYSKLNVNNRYEAMLKAVRLHMF